MSGRENHYPKGRTLGLLKLSRMRRDEDRVQEEEKKRKDEQVNEVSKEKEVKKVEAEKEGEILMMITKRKKQVKKKKSKKEDVKKLALLRLSASLDFQFGWWIGGGRSQESC